MKPLYQTTLTTWATGVGIRHMGKSQGHTAARSWKCVPKAKRGFFKAPSVLFAQAGKPDIIWAKTVPSQAPDAPAHLHPNDGIDEEKHGNQKADVGKGLEGKQRYAHEFQGRQLPGSATCSPRQYRSSHAEADFYGLHSLGHFGLGVPCFADVHVL